VGENYLSFIHLLPENPKFLMKYSYTSVSEIGLKRIDNEDSVCVTKTQDGLLIIVCDGLGGNNAGDIASELTLRKITEYFNESAESDILVKIKNAIEHANMAVLKAASKNFDHKGMATTVEVLFLKDNDAFWGHVGDSRIYIFRNNKLKQLTKDHSLIQKLVDDGHLTFKQAENHPNKNIIMRALGDAPDIEVDISKLRLNPQEDVCFFICTDGVTTVIKDPELELILSNTGPSLQNTAKKISYLVTERGAPDNFTFVLLKNQE
jgi:PPM family protein phosphatase